MTTKAPPLPTSLSPHVLTTLSPDLVELLTNASLPPLHHILQSYAPLRQVTTRTTGLQQVSHQAFHLRFSDLDQITLACKEDEETRSSRFIDWLGSRIARRAPKWVEDVKQQPILPNHSRTPWWDELRKCVEGDWVPSRSEGWNHPVAIIYAVSTLAPNPLQAVTNLYSRPLDLPSWIDPTIFRYILIVNPVNSPLNPDECNALYNAVRKQHTPEVYMLHLSLSPASKSIPINPLPPQPPPSSIPPSNSSHPVAPVATGSSVPDTSELWLNDADVQATGKFVRQFLVESLLVWMERNTQEWNNSFANSNRLGSRILSSFSTRRILGSSTGSPATPTTGSTTGSFAPLSPASAGSPPPQQRRLAEFATFLGDFNVALRVWESLRKEGKAGPAILPLISQPSPEFINFAAQALAPVFGEEPSATALKQTLAHAVRWEIGVPNLLNLGGERWFAWAAGTIEEASTALLLGHAAHLSRFKGSRRRAALWYAMAAHRLEKCGIKSLAAYFLREAHSICISNPAKNLSPSFEEAEQWPVDPKNPTNTNWPIVLTNIEHSLGRLHYSSGDTEGAIKLFLGILKYSRMFGGTDSDAVIIDDFKQALEHLESLHPKDASPSNFHLPITFCIASESKIRLNTQNEQYSSEGDVWERLEARWAASREKGKGKLEQSSAEVGLPFWIDIALENPVEAPVILKNFTLLLDRPGDEATKSATDLATCEILDEVSLYPKERRNISISVTPHQPGSLSLYAAQYCFISNLPVKESLEIRGKRLNSTPAQMRGVEYAPSKRLTLNVRQGGLSIDAQLLDNNDEEDGLVLVQGEVRSLTLRLTNRGAVGVGDIWLLTDDTILLWVDDPQKTHNANIVETMQFPNQITEPKPIRIPLESLSRANSFVPGQSIDINATIHAPGSVDTRIYLLLAYSNGGSFYCTRLAKEAEVIPILSLAPSIVPTPTRPDLFALRLEVENIADELEIELDQISVVATDWVVRPGLRPFSPTTISSQQISRVSLSIAHHSCDTTQATNNMVVRRISDFLLGRPQLKEQFPPSFLQCSQFGQTSLSSIYLREFLFFSRRYHYLHALTRTFPTIPLPVLQTLFPLYTPHSLDVLLFWTISERKGFITFSDLQVGVGHGLLHAVLENASRSKGKSIYAETKREHELLLEHFRECEWNRETDPLVVSVKSEQSSVKHNFNTGSCLVPIEFTLRNYSPTNPLKYRLQLPSNKTSLHQRYAFTASYSGQLTHRGQISPFQTKLVKALLRVPSEGQFSLSGWRVEVEVGDVDAEQTAEMSDADNGGWKTLRRYMQVPEGVADVVLVRNAFSS